MSRALVKHRTSAPTVTPHGEAVVIDERSMVNAAGERLPAHGTLRTSDLATLLPSRQRAGRSGGRQVVERSIVERVVVEDSGGGRVRAWRDDEPFFSKVARYIVVAVCLVFGLVFLSATASAAVLGDMIGLPFCLAMTAICFVGAWVLGRYEHG